jgi:hypothetical protein
LEQIERDRRLIPEEPQELHLLEREPRLLRPVEDIEDADCLLLMDQRHGHQSLGHVAGLVGDLASAPTRILAHVVENQRLPRHQNPTRNTGTRWEALPDKRVRPLAGNRLEDELVRLFVVEEDRCRPRVENSASDLDGRLEQRSVRRLRGEHSRRNGRPKIRHPGRPRS